jgi:hypothetical protein
MAETGLEGVGVLNCVRGVEALERGVFSILPEIG